MLLLNLIILWRSRSLIIHTHGESFRSLSIHTWVGRESSHGRKELFNLPPLVLKARAPNDGSAFCIGFSRLEVPEQTLGGIPLGLGMVMKINFFEFSCS